MKIPHIRTMGGFYEIKRLKINKPNIQHKKLAREQLNKLKESRKKEM